MGDRGSCTYLLRVHTITCPVYQKIKRTGVTLAAGTSEYEASRQWYLAAVPLSQRKLSLGVGKAGKERRFCVASQSVDATRTWYVHRAEVLAECSSLGLCSTVVSLAGTAKTIATDSIIR
jgi:hypothetical protein